MIERPFYALFEFAAAWPGNLGTFDCDAVCCSSILQKLNSIVEIPLPGGELIRF